MEFKVAGISIKVEANKGIYRLDSQSAVGKTYFYMLLKDAKYAGIAAVDAYSYSELVNNTPVSGLFSRTNEVIMLDRYDMYSTLFRDEIRAFGKHGIVFLDLKNWQIALPTRPSFITLTQEGVLVQSEDFI